MAWMYRPSCFNNENELRQSSLKATDSRKWATFTRGSSKWITGYKNEEGAASLQEMAWRSVMVHIDWVDEETLKNVPWSIGKRLWQRLGHNDLVSIATWQKFVKAYHDEIEGSKPRNLMIHANSPRIMTYDSRGRGSDTIFTSYLTQITAPKFEWINLMTLVDASLPREDWIQLSKLPNLGALYIQNSSGALDNVVVRAWSLAAQEIGAFSVLRVMVLCNQSSLTLGILEDLRWLPSLRVLHLTGLFLKSYGMQDTIKGSRWRYQSSLCLKLYAAWHARQCTSTRLKDVYNLTVRKDVAEDIEGDKPLLNVVSGPDPPSRGIAGIDQLWFELAIANGEDEVLKAKTSHPTRNNRHQVQKKLKLRQSAQQSMSDLIGDIYEAPAG